MSFNDTTIPKHSTEARTYLLGEMSPSELGEIFDIPEVVMVIAPLFPSDWGVVECQSHSLGDLFVSKLNPAFSVVLFLVAAKLLATSTHHGVCKN